MINNSIISLIVLFTLAASCKSKTKIDTVILAARVYTADKNFNTTTAIAIKDGRIIETGNKERIQDKYDPKKTIDATGKFVYPGFIDAHCHFAGYALDLYKCDLVGTTSFDDVVARIKDYEKDNKLPWIYGRGWDQNDWSEKAFPTKDILDTLFSNKPVILKRIDGHAILCNQKALDKAGITKDTHIDGGIIEIKNGQLTGILIDNAADPVEKTIPLLPKEQCVSYLQKAEEKCYRLGLTGVVDCGLRKEIISLLQDLYKDTILSIGNTILLTNEKATLDAYVKEGPIYAGQFRITGIKLYADGALGSRGACLLHEYTDQHGHYGLLLTQPDSIKKIATDAKAYKWQLCTHAIGDSANRTILHVYAKILKNKNDLRWRIEHAQVVNPSDLHYFSDYSIIPSVQPTHATSDMPWAESRLGNKRLHSAYSYEDLLKQNGWIALGTDFPVEEINPLGTFYAAVSRKDKDGKPAGGFLPENALTRQEALKGMTIWAAKSVFNEHEKGSIEIGKDADLVILDRDIMEVPEDQILQAKVICTLVKGKIKYKE